MAYNFIGESSAKICWEDLNKRVQPFRLMEYVPMPSMGVDGGDAIGLSVAAQNIGPAVYQELLQVMKLLQQDFHCVLYNMYYGTIVDSHSLEQIKKDIT